MTQLEIQGPPRSLVLVIILKIINAVTRLAKATVFRDNVGNFPGYITQGKRSSGVREAGRQGRPGGCVLKIIFPKHGRGLHCNRDRAMKLSCIPSRWKCPVIAARQTTAADNFSLSGRIEFNSLPGPAEIRFLSRTGRLSSNFGLYRSCNLFYPFISPSFLFYFRSFGGGSFFKRVGEAFVKSASNFFAILF